MSIRIDGTNTTANPGITGADTDTGLQFGTNEIKFVTDGTEKATVDNSGNLLFNREASSDYPEQQLKWSNDSTTTNGFYIVQDSDRNGKIWHEQGLDVLFGTNDSERMRLDSSGRLMLGTTTEGYSGADTLTVAESGNAGITIRTGTSQNGTIAFSDATSGDAEFDGYIQYSQSSREMRIATGSQVRLLSDQDGKLFVKNSFSDSSRNVAIQIECSGQGRGRILSGNSDTDSASFGAGSDRRLKTNIRNYTGGLERIRQIPVKIYDEVNSGVTDVISWVADEVAPIFPEAVIGEANAVDAEGNPEYQILSSLKFFPDLVQCVQTLIDKVETLETQNTAQQAQIDDLLTRVTALEAAE